MSPATKVLQYVCFYPIEIPTQQGDAYFYCFVDAFSQFAFSPQVETEFSDELLLRHVKWLCSENKDFTKALHSQGNFTLVFHKYEQLLPQLNGLLRPLGGNAIVDPALVDKVMIPFMEQFFERMINRT